MTRREQAQREVRARAASPSPRRRCNGRAQTWWQPPLVSTHS